MVNCRRVRRSPRPMAFAIERISPSHIEEWYNQHEPPSRRRDARRASVSAIDPAQPGRPRAPGRTGSRELHAVCDRRRHTLVVPAGVTRRRRERIVRRGRVLRHHAGSGGRVEEEIEQIPDRADAAGGRITDPAGEAAWFSGSTGYFADPDGYVRESVAFACLVSRDRVKLVAQ